MHEADDVAEATRRSLLPDGGAGAPPTTRAGQSGPLSAGNAAAVAASGGVAAAEAEDQLRSGEILSASTLEPGRNP
eukprot:1407356-Prymnesium_polylepis.1